MNFTFKEWQSIRHHLEVAAREYDEMMETCKESDNEYSMYQIFKRQAAETRLFIERIDNTIL